MRSLINPFSPLRYLDLWSIAAFGSRGESFDSLAVFAQNVSIKEVEEAAHDIVAGEYTVENFVSEQAAKIDLADYNCVSLGPPPDTPADEIVPQLVIETMKAMNDILGPGEGQITPDMMFNDGNPMGTGVFGKEAADTAPDATIAAAQDDGGATEMGASLGGKETDGRGEAKPDPVAEKVQQTMDETTVQGASPSETGDDQDDQTAEVPASVDP